MAPEIIVDKPGALADTVARRFEEEARGGLADRGRVSVALSGGSVATVFFPRLAQANVDWSRTDFFWCDERAVPPTDPESNFGVAHRLWLQPAGVPEGRIHRMEADVADPSAAAEAYAATMVRVLGQPPRFDVVFLGMGPDGHICSLFPGHPLLEERERTVAVVLDSPKPPAARLTLTLGSRAVRAIARGRRIRSPKGGGDPRGAPGPVLAPACSPRRPRRRPRPGRAGPRGREPTRLAGAGAAFRDHAARSNRIPLMDSEIGLYYYRARYYDPAIGRFLTTDPVGDQANGCRLADDVARTSPSTSSKSFSLFAQGPQDPATKIYAWMSTNNSPKPGTNESCGCKLPPSNTAN